MTKVKVNEKGQDLVEYALISILVLAAIAALIVTVNGMSPASPIQSPQVVFSNQARSSVSLAELSQYDPQLSGIMADITAIESELDISVANIQYPTHLNTVLNDTTVTLPNGTVVAYEYTDAGSGNCLHKFRMDLKFPWNTESFYGSSEKCGNDGQLDGWIKLIEDYAKRISGITKSEAFIKLVENGSLDVIKLRLFIQDTMGDLIRVLVEFTLRAM